MASEPGQLRRVLRRRDLMALAWGAMIGWGWVILSGAMSEDAGTLGSATAFVIAGVVIGWIGVLYAEFTARIPRAGGELAFCFAGLGPRVAALCAWSLGLAYIAVCAFEAVALPRVLLYLFPVLEGPALYTIAGAPVSWQTIAIGSAGVLAISIVNALGIKPSAWVQIGGSLILAAGGVTLFATAATQGSTDWMPPLWTGTSGLLAVLIMTPFLFAGFDVIPQVAEETRVSPRQVCAVMLGAIAMAAFWYAAVQLSIGVLLPAAERGSAELVPVVAVETGWGGAWAGRLVLVGGLFGILTSWNAMFIGAVRLVFAMGRGGMLPSAFARLHPRTATPLVVIAFLTVVSLAAPWLGRQALVWFVDAGAFATLFAYFLVACAYVAIRRRDGVGETVLRVTRWRGFPASVLVLTALFLCLYLPGSPVALAWPEEWGIVVLWLAIGLLLCGPRLRPGRFDHDAAEASILGAARERREP